MKQDNLNGNIIKFMAIIFLTGFGAGGILSPIFMVLTWEVKRYLVVIISVAIIYILIQFLKLTFWVEEIEIIDKVDLMKRYGGKQ